MDVQIVYKNISHGSEIEKRFHQKSKKLEKYFKKSTQLHWTVSQDGGKYHVDGRFVGPHFEFEAKSSGSDVFDALDLVLDKLDAQLRKLHDKWKNKIHRSSAKDKAQINGATHEADDVWAEHDENEEYDDVKLA